MCVALVAGAGAASVLGCKPDLGAPPSLILGAQLLDIQATPAEAKPGAEIMLDTLLVDPTGTLAAPVTWTTCRTPKPPAESNAISRACVDQPDDGPAALGRVRASLPLDACSLFGPLTPPAAPGQPAVRPRDPDPTGGFYQPIRAAVRGLPGAAGDLVGFALVRVSCLLANAPTEIARAFNDPDTGYHANAAPILASVTMTDAAGLTAELPRAGDAAPAPVVHAGEAISFRVSWPAEAAETFRVFDLATYALIEAHESLRVSWFTTAGTFDHDRTGRASDETELFSDNTWNAPADAPTVSDGKVIHFWVVLRDSRGGSASAAFDLDVAP